MGEGKAAAVNQAFEDAVNEMIAEAKEPETAEPEEIEQVTEPVVMTEEHTAAPPDAVMDAVRDKIYELQKQVDERATEIALLNEKIRSLNAWLTEVQA
jgi:flagellar motility protein MotE (MotC chaperone)